MEVTTANDRMNSSESRLSLTGIRGILSYFIFVYSFQKGGLNMFFLSACKRQPHLMQHIFVLLISLASFAST